MEIIRPLWPAPDAVRAFTSTRQLSDEALLEQELFEHTHCRRIKQVHGIDVVSAVDKADDIEADACFSRDAFHACRVVTADCLTLLICNQQGTEVAAVHAGWRGLAAGVVENCVARLHSAPGDLLVWMGPAISQRAFEVGGEVLARFLAAAPAQLREPIRDCFRPGVAGKYFADLYGLARIRLENLGVSRIFGGEYCTFEQDDLFYSYRRDGTAGRMISVIVFR